MVFSEFHLKEQPTSQIVDDVASLLTIDNPAELVPAVKAAARFIQGNLNEIGSDDARQITQMLLENAAGIPGLEPLLQALKDKQRERSPRLELIRGGKDEDVMSGEEAESGPEISEQLLDRADQLKETFSSYLEDIKKGIRGSVVEARNKIGKWRQEVDAWPADAFTKPVVREATGLLDQLESALASAELK